MSQESLLKYTHFYKGEGMPPVIGNMVAFYWQLERTWIEYEQTTDVESRERYSELVYHYKQQVISQKQSRKDVPIGLQAVIADRYGHVKGKPTSYDEVCEILDEYLKTAKVYEN